MSSILQDVTSQFIKQPTSPLKSPRTHKQVTPNPSTAVATVATSSSISSLLNSSQNNNRRYTADMSAFNNLMADLDDISDVDGSSSARRSSSIMLSTRSSGASSRSPRRRDTLDLLGDDMTSYSNVSSSGKRRKRRDTLDMLGMDDLDASDGEEVQDLRQDGNNELEISFNPNSSVVSNTSDNTNDTSNTSNASNSSDKRSSSSDQDDTFDMLNGSDESSFNVNGRRNTMDLLNFYQDDIDSPGSEASKSISSNLSSSNKRRRSSPLAIADVAPTTSATSPAAFAALFGNESLTSPPLVQHSIPIDVGSNQSSSSNMEKSAMRAPPLKSAMKKKTTTATARNEGASSSSSSSQQRRGKSHVSAVLASTHIIGRTVVFGSPAVAEFDLQMPPTSMRKLPAKDAKRMFSMAPAPSATAESSESDVDELTANNASVLAEMDEFDSGDEDDATVGEKGRTMVTWSSSRRRRSSAASSSSLRPVSTNVEEQDHQMILNDSIVSDEDGSSNMQEVSFNRSAQKNGTNWAESGSSTDSGSSGSDSDDDSDDDSDVDMSMTMQEEGDMLSAVQRRQSSSGTKRSSAAMSGNGSSSSSSSSDDVINNNGKYSNGKKRMRVENSSRAAADVDDRTVELESLGDLLSVKSPGSNTSIGAPQEQEQQHTVQLEGGLGNLLQEFDGDDSSDTSSSEEDQEDQRDDEDEDESQMVLEGEQPTQTIELEGGMVSLIANMSRDEKDLGVDEDDHTIELEHGLGSLLDGLSPTSSVKSSARSRTSSSRKETNSPNVTSPSTPGLVVQQISGSVSVSPVPVQSSRKTPVPQAVTLETIANALQVGNALESKVFDHEQLDTLASEFSTMTSELSNKDIDILLQRRESIVKIALLLKDRCIGLHTKLTSGSFRVRLQKLARIFLNNDTQASEEMSRAAALFMAVARAEARVDWAGQANEIETVTVEALAHSAAVLEFDGKTINAHNREILDLKRTAIHEIQVLDNVNALHVELKEQEQLLTMFTKQRDEAISNKNQYDLTLKTLRQEGTRLQNYIDSQKAVTVERQQLVARTKVLEEIHDVCRSLSAWKLTRMVSSRVELIYEHSNGSFHVIQVEFAAKAPGLICSLQLNTSNMNKNNVLDSFSNLIASFQSRWNNMVQNSTSLIELQRSMQTMDVEIGRMQALDADISSLSKHFVIPKGIHFSKEEQESSICSFTVNFSCLEPASKWNVNFEILRGYPFSQVNIVPETEFGNSPVVSEICDVAFGYNRLERACQYLQDIFYKHIKKK